MAVCVICGDPAVITPIDPATDRLDLGAARCAKHPTGATDLTEMFHATHAVITWRLPEGYEADGPEDLSIALVGTIVECNAWRPAPGYHYEVVELPRRTAC